jgi:CheY-like chemotaxis protein
VEQALSMMRILYLENHAVFAQQVTRQFLAGHRVTVIPSLSAARRELTTSGYDLVLSDYDLDDGKGDVSVRELRAAHPDLPIIAVSSHDAGNATRLRAGASAVCSKMEFQRIAQVVAGLANESGKN